MDEWGDESPSLDDFREDPEGRFQTLASSERLGLHNAISSMKMNRLIQDVYGMISSLSPPTFLSGAELRMSDEPLDADIEDNAEDRMDVDVLADLEAWWPVNSVPKGSR